MELWTCVCLFSKPVSIPSPPCSYVSDVTPSSQTNRHLVLGPLLFPAPCVSLDFLPFLCLNYIQNIANLYYWKAYLTSSSNKYSVRLLWTQGRLEHTELQSTLWYLTICIIQELLLKISLVCISSAAPHLKDYNTTNRRYHCQDYLQQEGDMMQIIKNHLWTYIISVKISTVDSIHHTGCNIKITKTNAKKYLPCWYIPK